MITGIGMSYSSEAFCTHSCILIHFRESLHLPQSFIITFVIVSVLGLKLLNFLWYFIGDHRTSNQVHTHFARTLPIRTLKAFVALALLRSLFHSNHSWFDYYTFVHNKVGIIGFLAVWPLYGSAMSPTVLFVHPICFNQLEQLPILTVFVKHWFLPLLLHSKICNREPSLRQNHPYK